MGSLGRAQNRWVLLGKLGIVGIARSTQYTHKYPIYPLTAPPTQSPRPNLLSKGSRYNARQKSRRWAVLWRTAHCRDFLLAAVDAAFSRQINLLSKVVRCGLSQKNSPRDSTLKYSPWGITIGIGRRLRLFTANYLKRSGTNCERYTLQLRQICPPSLST